MKKLLSIISIVTLTSAVPLSVVACESATNEKPDPERIQKIILGLQDYLSDKLVDFRSNDSNLINTADSLGWDRSFDDKIAQTGIFGGYEAEDLNNPNEFHSFGANEFISKIVDRLQQGFIKTASDEFKQKNPSDWNYLFSRIGANSYITMDSAHSLFKKIDWKWNPSSEDWNRKNFGIGDENYKKFAEKIRCWAYVNITLGIKINYFYPGEPVPRTQQFPLTYYTYYTSNKDASDKTNNLQTLLTMFNEQFGKYLPSNIESNTTTMKTVDSITKSENPVYSSNFIENNLNAPFKAAYKNSPFDPEKINFSFDSSDKEKLQVTGLSDFSIQNNITQQDESYKNNYWLMKMIKSKMDVKNLSDILKDVNDKYIKSTKTNSLFISDNTVTAGKIKFPELNYDGLGFNMVDRSKFKVDLVDNKNDAINRTDLISKLKAVLTEKISAAKNRIYVSDNTDLKDGIGLVYASNTIDKWINKNKTNEFSLSAIKTSEGAENEFASAVDFDYDQKQSIWTAKGLKTWSVYPGKAIGYESVSNNLKPYLNFSDANNPWLNSFYFTLLNSSSDLSNKFYLISKK